MRYSKIIDSEDEKLFDHNDQIDVRGRDAPPVSTTAAAGASKPPNSNAKVSRKSKKENSQTPVKINFKSEGRIKSREKANINNDESILDEQVN